MPACMSCVEPLNSNQNPSQISHILYHLNLSTVKTQMCVIAQDCMVDYVSYLFLMIKDLIFIHPFVVSPCINAIAACKPQTHCCC